MPANFPYEPSVYLAGPIREVTPEQRDRWREEAADLLGADFIVHDPCSWQSMDPAQLVRADLAAIDASDVVIAWLPSGLEARGTTMELLYTRLLNKPLIVWGHDLPGSLWVDYCATAHATDLYHACAIALKAAEAGLFRATRNGRAARDILDERQRQDHRWGQQDHSDLYWLGIASEELGELAKEIIESAGDGRIRAELVQLAAVAQAWVEAIDRRSLVVPEEVA